MNNIETLFPTTEKLAEDLGLRFGDWDIGSMILLLLADKLKQNGYEITKHAVKCLKTNTPNDVKDSLIYVTSYPEGRVHIRTFSGAAMEIPFDLVDEDYLALSEKVYRSLTQA